MAHAAWSVVFHLVKAYTPNSLLNSSTLNAYKNADLQSLQKITKIKPTPNPSLRGGEAG